MYTNSLIEGFKLAVFKRQDEGSRIYVHVQSLKGFPKATDQANRGDIAFFTLPHRIIAYIGIEPVKAVQYGADDLPDSKGELPSPSGICIYYYYY
jgi:hypothetical protein